jgi:EmrB/QacA subfamily drug resistance transporter
LLSGYHALILISILFFPGSLCREEPVIEERREISLADREGKLIIAACILASGVGFLMNSAVTIALPTIQRSLETTITGVQWIVNAYALALGGLILISGALGDLYGVKRVFDSGIALFTAGSILSAAAPSVALLITTRAAQGVGAALMVPGSLALITTIFPDRERGRVIGLWAGVSGAIAALGPFIGGFLAELSWRYVFLAMAPLALAALVVSLRYVPHLPGGGHRRLDLPGAALAFLALFGLSFALIRASEQRFGLAGWLLLSGGAAALIAFFPVEARRRDPVVPFAMFTRQVAGANLATLFIYFSFQGTLFLLSFYLQQLLGLRASAAGLAILPTTVFIALFSGPSGALTDRRGPRLQMIAGPLVVCAAISLFAAADRATAYLPQLFAGVLLLGAGIVLIIPSITTSALNVPRRFSGTASGVNNAIARVSGLLAVAVVGTVLSLVFAREAAGLLAELKLPADTRQLILRRADRLLALELPESLAAGRREAVRAALEHAFVTAYRWGMLVNLAAAAAGVVTGVLTIPREVVSEGE